MTVVNPKSISGITSITTPSGSDDLLTIHTNNGTERLRIDSTGTTKIVTGIVTTLTATTGIVTTLTANTVTSLGAISGTTGTFSGAVSGTTGTFSGDVSIADKIVHTGDTNTSIRFSDADTIKLETGGSERLRVDSTGDTIVSGTLFADSDLFVVDQIRHTGDTNTAIRFPSADTITAETSGSERLRISSDGEVMIGTTTEGHSDTDNLTIADSSNSGITIRSGASNQGAIYFSDATSGTGEYAGFVGYNHSSDSIFLGANTGTKMTIDSSGNMTLSAGNLVMGTAGKGIDFSATADGGSGSVDELLDDYEEGTWSPQIYYQNSTNQSNSTNNASYGWYTKIGNLVTVSLFLRWSLTGSPANDNNGIKNFPFTSSTVTSTYGNAGAIAAISHAGTNLASDACIIFKWQNDNSTTGLFELPDSTSNLGNEMGANTGMRVWANFTYRTSQ